MTPPDAAAAGLGRAPTPLLLRRALPADDAELRRLAREVPMVGALTYCLEREPAFFAFTNLQGDETDAFVVEAPGGRNLAAMGSASILNRRIGRQARRVLYLGDLRVSLEHRRQGIPARMYLATAQAAREAAVDLSYSLVLGGNRAMDVTLARMPKPIAVRRLGMLRSHSFLLGGSVRVGPGVDARRATSADLPQMVALWNRLQATRDLAPDLPTEEAFRARLGRSGGVTVEDFSLVLREGRLTGFGAVWDPSRVRQVRVLRTGRSLAALRAVYNPVAQMLGRPPMPANGAFLRSLYLTLWCAEAPQDLDALLCLARQEHRRSGNLFLEVALDPRDPLASAAQRGLATRVDYNVVAFGWDGTEPPPCDQPVYQDLGLA